MPLLATSTQPTSSSQSISGPKTPKKKSTSFGTLVLLPPYLRQQHQHTLHRLTKSPLPQPTQCPSKQFLYLLPQPQEPQLPNSNKSTPTPKLQVHINRIGIPSNHPRAHSRLHLCHPQHRSIAATIIPPRLRPSRQQEFTDSNSMVWDKVHCSRPLYPVIPALTLAACLREI